jgi:hypothetical protein
LTAAQILTGIADLAEVFCTPDGDTGYATVEINGHRETWPVRSKGFRRWLTRKYFEVEGKPPGGQALADAIGAIEARAQFSDLRYPVAVRIAASAGNVYVDLANEKWEVVEVTPAGWRVVSEYPVKFRRTRGMLPLPHPVSGGSIGELRPFVNVRDKDWTLVVGWLLGAFRPTGPYPVLALGGEHGAAKSTTSLVCRRCIDPNTAGLRAEPADVRDVMIAASNSWIIALDNLSALTPWLSDALCRLATGGGFGTRELYSDGDEVLFTAQRPIIVNSIDTIVSRADLMDRSLPLDLPTINTTQRRQERDFWRDFDAAHPRILGALLDAVSVGLLRLDDVHLPSLPRMADFAIWITAAEPALGWPEGHFLATYAGNQADANELVLDASPLTPLLRAMTDGNEWLGTMQELLDELNRRAEEPMRRTKGWPTHARALGGQLRRLAPNLRAIGIGMEFGKRGPGGRRLVSIGQNERAKLCLDRHNGHGDAWDVRDDETADSSRREQFLESALSQQNNHDIGAAR